MPKLTATFAGVTVSRRTNHRYTYVVFGLRSGELDARRVEAELADHHRDCALDAEALDFIRRGETPPAGHALRRVTGRNYYHAFTRWDGVARETNDCGRTFRTLSVAEAEAASARRAETYADYERRLIERAAAHRTAGERWIACSWHRSLPLAQKGAEKARSYGHITRVEIVPVGVA